MEALMKEGKTLFGFTGSGDGPKQGFRLIRKATEAVRSSPKNPRPNSTVGFFLAASRRCERLANGTAANEKWLNKGGEEKGLTYKKEAIFFKKARPVGLCANICKWKLGTGRNLKINRSSSEERRILVEQIYIAFNLVQSIYFQISTAD